MHRKRMILAIVICCGVFISGIGAGLSLWEFSSFSYAGEKELGFADMQSATLDYALDPTETGPFILAPGYALDTQIIEDKTVPVNTVRFRIRYNAESVKPIVNSSDGYIYLEYISVANRFKALMSGKDLFLEGLKNREIAAFKTTMVESVEVSVNPETRNRLYIE